MKRIAETKRDLIVEIPLVARIDPIGVEPWLAVIVPLDVEDVRVAIRIGYVQNAFNATTRKRISVFSPRVVYYSAS